MTLPAALLRILAGILASTGAGWAASRALTGGLTRSEKAAWAFATGWIVQSAALLLLLAFAVGPTAAGLLLLEAALAGLAWLAGRRVEVSAAAPPSPRSSPLLVGTLLAVAGAAWTTFLIGALSDPMWSTDYLAIWGFKGKVVYLTAQVPRRLFEDPALAFSHPEYPLLLPLALAGLAVVVGHWSSQALALLFPVAELATLLALFGFVSRRVARSSGAIAATLASLCVFLYRPVNAGTAEIPLALGLVLVSSAALDVIVSPEKGALARFAAAAFLCACLKQEGTVFVALLGGVVLWKLRGAGTSRRRVVAAAAYVPLLAHWALLHALRGNPPRRDFDFALLEPPRWSELVARAGLVAGRLLGTEAWQALPPLLAVALYLSLTRRGIGDVLGPAFAAQLGVYALAFSLSAFGPLYAIDAAFGRLAMTLFPAFALLLAARSPVSPDPAV